MTQKSEEAGFDDPEYAQIAAGSPLENPKTVMT
jgi:hypothetical protein